MSTALPPEPADENAQEVGTTDSTTTRRKSGRGKRILKNTGLVLALPGTILLGGIGYVLWEMLTNKPDNSPEHEASKREYLDQLSGMATSGDSPNVLLVYYDDLGYGDLGFMGDTPIKTPNIDALAADGVVMTNYHAPSAVCTPSRAAMLTGRLAPRAGVPEVLHPSSGATNIINVISEGFGITQAEITIPDVLQAAGYETGMIGK